MPDHPARSSLVDHHNNGQLEPPWRAGLRSARANLVPGLALQAVALALVLAYYHIDRFGDALDRFADWHMDIGLLVPVVSTALCGGLIPFLYLRCRRATRAAQSGRRGITLTTFWALKGAEISFLYAGLAWIFGADNHPSTIAAKTLVDMFVYCPLWAVPVTWLVYAWVESDFDHRLIAREMRRRGWYRRRVLPILIANLGVWLPAVAIIYSLPTALQLPLQNVVLCFFTLMLAHLARDDAATDRLPLPTDPSAPGRLGSQSPRRS